MNITPYTDDTLFDTLGSDWNALNERSATRNPFARVEWARTWWATYYPGALWVLTVTDGGELVGIAPFFIETTADNTRVLRFIGHIDVTDYMDILADNDQHEAVYTALAAYLADNRDQFDHIGLANIRESSPTYAKFAAALREHGFNVDFTLNEVAPIIDLPPTYDAYLKEKLNSRERKEVKRKMRHANGGEYDIQWYLLSPDHDIDAHTDTFLDLMGKAEVEKAEFLENTTHVTFFRQLIHAYKDTDRLYMAFMTIDGEPSATYFGFVDGERAYLYNSGLDPQKFGALSPGIVLLQYIIEDFIARGYTVFDFLRGNESYKYKMGAHDTHIYQLNAN